jgi:hypothetical protein
MIQEQGILWCAAIADDSSLQCGSRVYGVAIDIVDDGFFDAGWQPQRVYVRGKSSTEPLWL